MSIVLTIVFCLLFFASLVISFTSVIMWLKSLKVKKDRRKWGRRFFLFLLLMVVSLVAFSLTSENTPFAEQDTPDEIQDETLTNSESKKEDETQPSSTNTNWKEQFSAELVAEIESAFIEIGEKPEHIVCVEYVDVRETDLFDRRDYYVEFAKGKLEDVFDYEERTWIHSPSYRITTEEWHEGEPEREQYPREYLVTIKFWNSDNATNILQWSHTGNGKLQEQ